MKLKYNWETNKEVKLFLNKIYKNTLINSNDPTNTEIVDKLMLDFEEFLHIIKDSYDLERVMILLSGLKNFIIYDYENVLANHNYNSMPINYKENITVSKEYYEDDDSNSVIMRRIVLYYKLADYLLNFKNEDTIDFSRSQSKDIFEKGKRIRTQNLVNNGWLLLENILAREISERFTFKSINEHRSLENLCDNNLTEINATDDFYRITEDFGYTLNLQKQNKNNYSKMDIGDTRMAFLIEKAINENFSKSVIEEYKEKEEERELYQVLYYMGAIFNEQNPYYLPDVKLSDVEYQEILSNLETKLVSLSMPKDKRIQYEDISFGNGKKRIR